jgi:putative pyruvate formate lyase activating enzyme
MRYEPSYLNLYEQGHLKQLADDLEERAFSCSLCPHDCGVDRSRVKNGRCRSGLLPVISSWSPHFGEEAPLVGRKGSGTIFFTNCNLSCIFCQNYDISALGHGKEVSYRDLAMMMISLQEQGCHNINFVTPTHMVYAITRALLTAVSRGLHLPLVYNSGGYDSVETLRLMKGVFDIYMPDFKYSDADTGYKLSGIKNYPEIAKGAVSEMYSQVGDLEADEAGVAYKGLLVRHLVLPNNLAGTRDAVDFLAGLSRNTYLNIMDQYRPEYRAREHLALRRRVTLEEFDVAVNHARGAGMKRVGRF